MATNQSPLSASETGSCSTPGYPNELRKRKRSGSASQPPREYGLMRDTGEHDVARFVGSGSGIHYVRAVYLRLARRSASRLTQATTINTLVPGEDDQLGEAASDTSSHEKALWKPNEVLPTPGAETSSLCFEDLVDWSKSFFESWHPVLPFLHGPDVLRIFEDAASRGVASIPALDYTILRSVLSISLADSRQSTPLAKPIPSNLVFHSVEEAVRSSQFALSQPASIRATQTALAIQLFLISMLRLNAASRLGGLIVRMAFHLGLHRCPTRFPFFTPEEASLRRRVLWCVYILERFLCQALGLPLDIHDDDLDVCYPGEECHGSPNQPTDGIERLQLLTFLAKHARIRGLILELRNKSVQQRQDTADRTAAVQTELAKWANEIQDAVEEDDDEDSVDDPEILDRPRLCPSHRLMLLVLKHESTMCLNRPGLASEPSSTSYSSAFQSCISAAKSICILFKRHNRKFKLKNAESEKRLAVPLLWPSFTWSVWISTFVLVHAAFENQVPLNSALRHAMAGKDMLRHLATRETSWPEYCLEAIDELISTVQELSRTPPTFRSSPTSITNNQVQFNNGAAQAIPQGQDKTSSPRKRIGNVANWNTSTGGLEADSAVESTTHDGSIDASQESSAHVHNSASFSGTNSFHTRRSFPTQSGGVANSVNYGMNTPTPNRQGLVNLQPGSAMPLDVSQNQADPGLVEGQESIMWYDQLFASSFSAIDNPFLAAAEFDASIDPTWNYLR